jgi:hypothetical protein
LGFNIREKIHKSREHYKIHRNAHSARPTPEFIVKAMESKQTAKEDEEFKSYRLYLDNMRVLKEVPHSQESENDDLHYSATDLLKIDTSNSPVNDSYVHDEDQQIEDVEDMEISS